MKKLVSVALAMTMTLTSVLPCFAQTSEVAATTSTAADCVEKGRADGKAMGTGGAFTIGLVSGVGLGLLGTLIAWVAQGEPDPPATEAAKLENAECRLNYADAYAKSGKRKKRGAALTGGLIGTAAIVAVLVSSGSGGSE